MGNVAALAAKTAPGSVEQRADAEFVVSSFTSAGSYGVSLRNGSWECRCMAWQERPGRVCKHIARVLDSLDPRRPPEVTLGPSPTRRRTYSQAWPAYDAAQQAEHPLFDPLLWSLLELVPDSLRAPGQGGRPPVSLRTQLLMAVKKVHLQESSRRVRGLLATQYAHGKGILGHVPNYAVPSRVFNRPETAQLLLRLIEESSYPLRDLLDGGTVAVDSTGFCTTCRGSYCTEKHDPTRRHCWIKAHLVVDVATHLVVGVKVTDDKGADCPQFVELLRGVARRGLRPLIVVADKAYLSRENLAAAGALGIDPYIPFKVNSVGSTKGCRLWQVKFHQFHARSEEFDWHYHQRSNVEAAISAIKRKLGEPLLSHNSLARFNELLAKVLAYNLGVLVHEFYEHGIDAGVSLPRAAARADHGTPRGEALRDATSVSVTEPTPGDGSP